MKERDAREDNHLDVVRGLVEDELDQAAGGGCGWEKQ